jgi:hypothetical protein
MISTSSTQAFTSPKTNDASTLGTTQYSPPPETEDLAQVDGHGQEHQPDQGGRAPEHRHAEVRPLAGVVRGHVAAWSVRSRL